jgi:hypothetical protein
VLVIGVLGELPPQPAKIKHSAARIGVEEWINLEIVSGLAIFQSFKVWFSPV